MSIEQEVIDIVVAKLGVDPKEVTLEKSFLEDLDADSLDLMELIMILEERFVCDLTGVSETFKTVGDAVAYIEKIKAAESK